MPLCQLINEVKNSLGDTGRDLVWVFSSPKRLCCLYHLVSLTNWVSRKGRVESYDDPSEVRCKAFNYTPLLTTARQLNRPSIVGFACHL